MLTRLRLEQVVGEEGKGLTVIGSPRGGYKWRIVDGPRDVAAKLRISSEGYFFEPKAYELRGVVFICVDQDLWRVGKQDREWKQQVRLPSPGYEITHLGNEHLLLICEADVLIVDEHLAILGRRGTGIISFWTLDGGRFHYREFDGTCGEFDISELLIGKLGS